MSTPLSDDAKTVADDSTRRGNVSPRLRDEASASRAEPRQSKLPEPHYLSVGTRLLDGRLRIQSELGEGGMGVVYEAFDAERSEMVALKSIVQHTARDFYLLKTEFRAVADLVHANLVRLYELFVDDDHCFFTMELVAGVPFHKYVRPDDTLDEPALRRALPQLLSAVAAIHGAGKLHRDLKPSNVLVDPDGRVVVLDFGLVVESGRDTFAGPMDEGAIVGTPGFMAPEQVSAERATPALDLYSIGVMLFQALTGALPFQGTSVEVMRAKQTTPAPAVRAVNPDAAADLAALCDELLLRLPQSRPSLEAVHERLRLAPPAPPSPRSIRVQRAPSAPPLIGRDRDLAVLRDAYRDACEGRRPVVALVGGESGIGKSALVESMLAELRTSGHALLLRGRCYEQEAVPYKAVDAVIDALSRYLRNDDGGELWMMKPEQLSALRRLFPVLGRIPMVADAPPALTTDVRELRRHGFEALAELLTRISQQRPLVVFIDDLQWGDTDSTALLLQVLLQPHAPRMLLVIAHRGGDELGHAVGAEAAVQNSTNAAPGALAHLRATLAQEPRVDVREHELLPLDAQAAEQLAQQLSSHDAAALAREAGGNPFLLGELSRCWSALAAPPPRGGISLAGALQQRVAQLGPSEGRLLQTLAVAARPVPLSIAARAADVEGLEHLAMDSLRQECLSRSASPSGSVECYHDRIREAVVSSLSGEALRSRHLALATVLASQDAADPEHLYTHYEQAGEHRLAARQAREAASRAISSLAFERAIGFCERALALGDFGAAERQQLCETRAQALAYAGRGPEAASAYLQAARDADNGRALALRRHAAEQLLMSGDLQGGHRLLADTLSDMGVQLPRKRAALTASLLYHRGRARLRGLAATPSAHVSTRNRQRLEALVASGSALSRTDPLAAAEVAARHRLLALKVGNATDIARALAWEVLFASMLELPTARLVDVIEHARSAAELSGDREAQASFHRHHGFYLRSKHTPDMPAALSELEASLAIHRAHPLPTTYYDRPWGEWNRDVVRSMLGRFSEVATDIPGHLHEALQRSDMCIFPVWASMVLPRLAIGEARAAEADFAHARRLWPSRVLTLQSLCMLEGETLLAHAAAEPERVTQTIEDAFAVVTGSALHRGASVVGLVAGLRARNAAQRAALTRDRAARRELLEVIASSVALMARSKYAWSDHTDGPVRAAAAYLQGDQEQAVEHLRRGATRLASIPLLAHACRRQLGVLLGGDEGKALVEASDAFFLTGGARDAARMAAILNPGFGD